jgi:hypothetical protein
MALTTKLGTGKFPVAPIGASPPRRQHPERSVAREP